MKIIGEEPDQKLISYVLSWVRQYNKGEAEAIIFDQPRSCLLVGTKKGNHAWVFFWNPQNKSDIFAPTHWYVWEAMPVNRRTSIARCYKEHKDQFDSTILTDFTQFRTE